MIRSIEHTLPIKAILAGTVEYDGGVLLLSHKQLRLHTDEQVAIVLGEPFRVHLMSWPHRGKQSLLTVSVRQKERIIEFCVFLPKAALSQHHLPNKMSKTPYMSPDMFARFWPALKALAELEDHPRLPDFRLDAVDADQGWSGELPDPFPFEVHQTTCALSLDQKATVPKRPTLMWRCIKIGSKSPVHCWKVAYIGSMSFDCRIIGSIS